MSNLSIKPQTVLLTSGRAVTFETTDAGGQPVSVNWNLNPPIGSMVTPGSGNLAAPVGATQTPSATYVAPPLVAGAQTIAVIANTGNESASATISLTPDAIAIVPASVDLKADQSQQFIAIVAAAPAPAGAPTQNVTWILSPPFGSLQQTGLYQAPHDIPESTTINVIAASPTLGKQAVAAVHLASPPWQGLGVQILGGFLLLVFSLVFLMVGLWPPAMPSPEIAKANRMEAEKTLQDKTIALEKADVAAADALAAAAKLRESPTATSGNKTDVSTAAVEVANTRTKAAEDIRKRADEAREQASKDLRKMRDDEGDVNNPNVKTRLADPINRELDLILLVLLAGTLGSFLHTAQSYSDYVGNRTIKSSWVWWYSFRPFIGAGLALVFYAAVRGGFMAIATGSNAKASELNPFGVVSIAAMVGMFSKAATMKLGEVFDTLFKSDKAKDSKDKLVPSSQPPSPPAGTAAVGSSTTSAAAK